MAAKKTNIANAMWGGRFSGGASELMERINRSIHIDKRLYKEDIAVSMAHALMLVHTGILSKEDGSKIEGGLREILAEIESGTAEFHDSLEDIHMNIEHLLREKIGPVAGKLHTARSRNDQVVTDVRLWLRHEIDALDESIKDLQAALLTRAKEHAATIMPGFTHLQIAQPITLGFHFLAYVEMLGRDRARLKDCRQRLNESPLGSGALAGTVFPIDRDYTAKILGFSAPTKNSMDSVSSRDFIIEFLGAGLNISLHLSRLAEELVLWTTSMFNFIRLSEDMTTGSSMMPQKRNPDAAELIRAKPGQMLGTLTGLAMVLKGLPLAYSKDMQEDKKSLFEAVDMLGLSLAAMTEMIAKLEVHKQEMAAALSQGFPTATDLADWLVLALDMPFREAHRVTGSLVHQAEIRKLRLEELPLEVMQETDHRITRDVYDVLSPALAVERRKSYGGTSPERVLEAIHAAEQRFITSNPNATVDKNETE